MLELGEQYKLYPTNAFDRQDKQTLINNNRFQESCLFFHCLKEINKFLARVESKSLFKYTTFLLFTVIYTLLKLERWFKQFLILLSEQILN